MATKTNPYDALVRRLEMTLSRQKAAIAETELQGEAARQMQVQFSTQGSLPLQAARKAAPGST